MKRYLLFIFPCYYPAGGMNDLRGDFDSVEEAIMFSKQWHDKSVDSIYCKSPEIVHEECYMHIYDLVDCKMILRREPNERWVVSSSELYDAYNDFCI